MKLIYVLLVATWASIAAGYVLNPEWEAEFNKTTYDRIDEHGYPVRVYYVHTEDDYVITMFRIPYSHKLQNQNKKRPAVLLQHGLLSSSDGWLLSGPNDALAFMLADAGYDVWLGNARGNRYSRNNTRLSPKNPFFWQFSWHEIGIYDIAAMIDHILEYIRGDGVHYVGHSQGTTVFLTLMSSRPEYNEKIRSAHMLAPVAFMSHMRTLMAKYTRRFVGRPNKLTRIIDTQEILPSTLFFVELQELFCKNHPAVQLMCSNLYTLWNGDPGTNGNANMTVLMHLNETHPAGASSTQVMHYMQEYESGHFRQFDFGEKKNLQKYGQSTPPHYDLSKITAQLYLYYADADTLSDPIDVEHLATLLPKQPHMFHVPDPTFSHGDFVTSMQVKEVINERIIRAIDEYEDANTL